MKSIIFIELSGLQLPDANSTSDGGKDWSVFRLHDSTCRITWPNNVICLPFHHWHCKWNVEAGAHEKIGQNSNLRPRDFLMMMMKSAFVYRYLWLFDQYPQLSSIDNHLGKLDALSSLSHRFNSQPSWDLPFQASEMLRSVTWLSSE